MKDTFKNDVKAVKTELKVVFEAKKMANANKDGGVHAGNCKGCGGTVLFGLSLMMPF